jgi:hypothetical protein
VFALAVVGAPTITCPGDIQVNQDTGQCGALVTFAPPTVTGYPTPTVSCELNGTPITSPFEFPVGVSTVNCTAENGNGSQSCSFTVTVLDSNPPVAGAFSLGASEGQPASVPVAKVLLKDQAPSRGTLSITAVTTPTVGGASVTLANGNITYTPAASFIGTDTINYTLSDGCGTVQGTIAVTVLSANLPGPNTISITTTLATTTVMFAGVPGANYVVQWAPNASQGPWTAFSGTLPAASNGLIQYTDTTSPKPPARFYRTQYVSAP